MQVPPCPSQFVHRRAVQPGSDQHPHALAASCSALCFQLQKQDPARSFHSLSFQLRGRLFVWGHRRPRCLEHRVGCTMCSCRVTGSRVATSAAPARLPRGLAPDWLTRVTVCFLCVLSLPVENELPPPENVHVVSEKQAFVLKWDYTRENVTFQAQWLQ